jgi:hypothetical protein
MQSSRKFLQEFHGTKPAQIGAAFIEITHEFARSFAPHNLKAVRPSAKPTEHNPELWTDPRGQHAQAVFPTGI